MKEVVIVSAIRTPIGVFGGALATKSAVELGIIAGKVVIEQSKVPVALFDEVFVGNVLSAGKGQNISRQIAIGCGLPKEVAATTISNVCGSGLKAVITGAQSILAGDNDVVLVGGTESMSQAAYVLEEERWGKRMGHANVIDTIISDGLTDAFESIHMGITAENLARKFGYSRKDQDVFSLNSQIKALKAQENNLFSAEIAPVEIMDRKGNSSMVEKDEGPRSGLSVEKLGKLKPAFEQNGTVTAGNASSINDGASMLVLMSLEKAKELQLKPLAKIKSYASRGVDPTEMGFGPVPATNAAMEKAELTINKIDLVEANEAFAVQALTVMDQLGIKPDKVNITGGAIALGHPIGASGARILTTLLYGLQREQKKIGLATLCVGGGMGVSMIVENLCEG